MKKYIYITLSVFWLGLCMLEVKCFPQTFIPQDYIGYFIVGIIFAGLSIKSVIEEL